MLKKLILLLLIPTISFAAAPTRQYNYVANSIIDPNQNNANENVLYNYLQTGVDTYATGSITNVSISPTAGIGYGQLSLSNSIVNADINSSAAIVASKLDLTSPGAIGSTSPNTGKFTNLTITGTFNSGTSNQGDIFYDNGSSIVRLTPGTSGQYLQTQGAAANPQWANVISSVTDYSTSTSSGTSKTLSSIKIVYGQYSFASSGSQAITNLPFTSTSSYQVTYGQGYGVTTTENIRVSKDSASQFTLYNDIARACTVTWIAIGS